MSTIQDMMIKKKKEKRTHDNFYLKEKKKFKDYYKFILSHVNQNLNNKDIIDIGCATGDFLTYVNEKFPKSNLHGLEINKKLHKVASKKKFIKNIFCNDILKIKKIGKYDFIFISGVHSIFDNLFPLLKKLKNLRKNIKSQIFIFGIWNPYDVDVFVRLKKNNTNILEKGWNVFSLSSLNKYLNKLNLKYDIYKFNLKRKIIINKKDPFRSWSYFYNNKTNIVINGSNIIHHFYLVKVK
jgi:SAM-dependent methyltransferase